MSTTHHTERAGMVRAMASSHLEDRGALMPILHDVMEEFGHIDPADIPVIAEVLNLSQAEVHGVVSFYHDFRTVPPPSRTVQLCRGEACQSVGAEALFAEATGRASGRDEVEVQQVFCLGNCALGPSGMVDGRLIGRLDSAKVAAAVEGVAP